MDNEKQSGQEILMIQLYKAPNERYEELDQSLEELKSKLNANHTKSIRWKSDAGISYFDWPGFMDLAALVTTTGAGLGIYNLLKLWLDNKNGRRFRIKIGDVEVEATQMKEDDFMKLVDRALEKNRENTELKESEDKTRIKVLEGSTESSFHDILTTIKFHELYNQQA